jgi:hypothetical protein
VCPRGSRARVGELLNHVSEGADSRRFIRTSHSARNMRPSKA